jgi:putative Mg2+ transporter-C (MgtC) family protein
MEQFWQGVVLDWPDTAGLLHGVFRLILASIVGALPGLQREQRGMPAGLRTHILVSLGAALFVMAALEAGAPMDATTRVIQVLATGIGFVGAGAILKSAQDHEIHGLTTAASVWLKAALGTAVGAGRIWLPLVGSVVALLTLSVLSPLEKRLSDRHR